DGGSAVTTSTASSVPHLDAAVATLTAAHPGAACRIARGARLVTAGAVSPLYGIGYLVAGGGAPGGSYWAQRVNHALACDGEDPRQRGCPCKHGWATVLFTACERLDAEQHDMPSGAVIPLPTPPFDAARH